MANVAYVIEDFAGGYYNCNTETFRGILFATKFAWAPVPGEANLEKAVKISNNGVKITTIYYE